jgi:hypothetical protein
MYITLGTLQSQSKFTPRDFPCFKMQTDRGVVAPYGSLDMTPMTLLQPALVLKKYTFKSPVLHISVIASTGPIGSLQFYELIPQVMVNYLHTI